MRFYAKLILVLLPLVIAYCWLSGTSFDPESIRGKRILLTGASSGIGEQVAYQYSELGAKLVITARRAQLLDKVAAKCKGLGAQQVWTVPADMSDPADRKKVVEATKKHLGGLDILILNHALLANPKIWRNTAENMTHLDNMMNINFVSFVDISSQVSALLEESKGQIGVVSSLASKSGTAGVSVYCTSKYALQGFYSSLRQEHRVRKTGVSVTLIVYGPIATEKAFQVMDGTGILEQFKSMAGGAREAAIVLVQGVAAKKYEIYFPNFVSYAVNLISLFPFAMEDFFSSMAEIN